MRQSSDPANTGARRSASSRGVLRRWLGPMLFVLLFCGALATTVYVVKTKTTDLMVEVMEMRPRTFIPDGDGRRDVIRITFFSREEEPAARVEIINGKREPVRVLDDTRHLRPENRVTYIWDGLDDDGRRANNGRYRIRVVMTTLDRSIDFPRRFTLDRDAVLPPVQTLGSP